MKKKCLSCKKEHLLCRHNRKSETQLAILGAVRQREAKMGRNKTKYLSSCLAHHLQVVEMQLSLCMPTGWRAWEAEHEPQTYKIAPGSNC